MLPPNFNLVLSDEAVSDLIDIQTYIFSEFGESQWKKYNQILENGLQHIMQFPESGHPRNDLPKIYLEAAD